MSHGMQRDILVGLGWRPKMTLTVRTNPKQWKIVPAGAPCRLSHL